MRRWRKHKTAKGASSSPPSPPPVELPDSREAEEALEDAKENRLRVQTTLKHEIHEFLEEMRAAREENNFAEGIVEIIRHGR